MSADLKALREKTGLSRTRFAKKVGIDVTTYSQMERGVQPGSIENRQRLAKFLELPYEEVEDPRSVHERRPPKFPPVLDELDKAAWEPPEPEERPRPKAWTFEPGKVYRISWGPSYKNEWYAPSGKKLLFLRDEGIHHIFKSAAASWLECFTDVQLMGCAVEAG